LWREILPVLNAVNPYLKLDFTVRILPLYILKTAGYLLPIYWGKKAMAGTS
jgi:hypothetical protein